MIALTLQCCPTDYQSALDLAQLICDLEPRRRENTEFYLIYRKDTPRSVPKAFNDMAKPKFGRASAQMARNHDSGWPGGSNMLAQSAFMEMSIMRRVQEFNNPAFLLFEPDCVPLVSDWIDQLSEEWTKVEANGKEAFGHWHQQGGPETLHMNGNAVFKATHFDRYPHLMIGPATMGWDYFYRDGLIEISQDSDLIHQLYTLPTIAEQQFLGIRKNGKRPALLHGIKDDSGRVLARKLLLNPVTA